MDRVKNPSGLIIASVLLSFPEGKKSLEQTVEAPRVVKRPKFSLNLLKSGVELVNIYLGRGLSWLLSANSFYGSSGFITVFTKARHET
jgi:hypothetical protein